MILKQPKWKNRHCDNCDDCVKYVYGDGTIGYWCWNENKARRDKLRAPTQVEANDRCNKWDWDGNGN